MEKGMLTLLLAAVLYNLFLGTSTEPILPCSSCANVTCGDPPTNCELDKIPCGCCPSCVRRDGENCEAFSPSCAKGLVCLTPGGMFEKRPPWYKSFLRGVCVSQAPIV